MTKTTLYRTVLWVLTIACAVLILSLSLQPATQSSGLSTGLTATVLGWFSGYRELPAEQQAAVLATAQMAVRELAHVCEYTALSLLATLLVCSYERRRLWLSVPCTAVFAVADECVQQWCAAGRAFQLIDLIKDWGGCLIGAAAVWLFYKLRSKKTGNGVWTIPPKTGH